MTKNKTLLFFLRKAPFRGLGVLLATALFLASCVSESIFPDYPSYNGEERTVSILLSPTATTRGVSRPVCDGERVQLNHGMLYLTTTAGVIVRHFQITPRLVSGTDTDLENHMINIACLEAGKNIEAVSGNIRRVVIVGNSQVALPTSGDVNTIIEGLVSGNVGGFARNTIASQHDVFTTHGVNMFADAPLAYISTSPDNVRKYGVEMRLAPLVARFEVAQITGVGQIRSFAVEGIFLDRYYRQARRNRTLVGATPVSLGSVSAEFQRNMNDFWGFRHEYASSNARYSGALFTQYVPAQPAEARTADGVIARPQGQTTWYCLITDLSMIRNNTWGFQVFTRYYRGQTPNVSSPNTTPPAIIVRLNNVVIYTGVGTETQNLGTQYITVNGFKIMPPHANAGTLLTDIRSSNVYRIVNLQFDETNLCDRPNCNPINVDVVVELATWNERPTYGTGFRQPSPLNISLGCGILHTFELSAAVCGDCHDGEITYLWQQSSDGVVWMDAVGINNNPLGHYTTTSTMTTSTYFRRLARCSCRPTRTITSHAARVTLPERILFPGLYAPIGELYWATRNVDFPNTFAAHPADAGRFFQWGTLDGVTNNHFHATYPAVGIPIPGWNASISRTAWTTANQPCPEGWRMPVNADFTALINAGSVWVTQQQAADLGLGCQAGRIFGVGANVNSFNPVTQIFIPAVGNRWNFNGNLCSWTVGIAFSIWGNTYLNSFQVYGLHSADGLISVHADNSPFGMSIRCVRIKLSQPDPESSWVPDGGRHTFNLDAAEGFGTIRYQWQSSADGMSGWTNIAGATSATFQTDPLTVVGGVPSHRFFRRVATDANGSHTTAAAEITVWALSNADEYRMFTAQPHYTGRVFQWGRITAWPSGLGPVGGGWDSSMPTGTAWYAENDPCLNGWRVATETEFRGLGAGSWTTNWNGTNVAGRIFGSAPNQLFLPRTSMRSNFGVPFEDAGYWSATTVGTTSGRLFHIEASIWMGFARNEAAAVRCVAR